MSEPTNTSVHSNWIYVVIGLVAIIGLLAGLLISNSSTPSPVTPIAQTQTVPPVYDGPTNPPDQRPAQRPPANSDASQNDVRRILRHLAPPRRREILQQAMKNAGASGPNRPRILMKKRRQLRQNALKIARTEPFDANALRKALDDVQKVNAQLAAQGTDLTIEVLQLMTPEERRAASSNNRQERRERRRNRN